MSRSSHRESLAPGPEIYGPVAPERPRPAHELAALMAEAHRACRERDATTLARAVAHIVSLAPESLSIDLTAVVEIAPRDLELATLRWTHLSKLLA